MNKWWHRRAVVALVLIATLLAPLAQHGWGAGAQEATPAGAPLATPVPGAQTWHVLVNNVSPDGENWSFNSFYPDHLRAHPGDTIVFTLASNPNAFHTVMVLNQDLTPMEMYQGFAGGFVRPLDPSQPDRMESTFFETGFGPPPCGRASQDPCPIGSPSVMVEFGVSSAVLVNPPPGSSQANTSFTVTLDPALPLGPYLFTSLVDGPTMIGWVDVVAPDQPVQSAGELAAAAERQYEADLVWLAGHDRVTNPPEAANPDGTKVWQVAAGGGSPDNPRLSINEFSLAPKVIHAGDTVTWTHHGPGAVAHTVSGFASTPDSIPDLSPYQPGCMTSSGELQLPPPGSFPPDIWNSCPGMEVNSLTASSQPSAPSGDPYTDGPRTSGILLNQAYLDSPIGEGLPFASSYSVTFPNTGTYHYHCAIHPGMEGTVVVVPPPFAG